MKILQFGKLVHTYMYAPLRLLFYPTNNKNGASEDTSFDPATSINSDEMRRERHKDDSPVWKDVP
jgi:hypothetical protein